MIYKKEEKQKEIAMIQTSNLLMNKIQTLFQLSFLMIKLCWKDQL